MIEHRPITKQTVMGSTCSIESDCSLNAGKMKKVSSFRIKKGSFQHFSHPVIHNGILYQRHGNVLMAYDIRKK